MNKKIVSLLIALACQPTLMHGQPNQSAFKDLKQITAAGDGVLFGLDKQDQIFAWTGVEWKQLSGSLSQISAGSKSEVWGVNASNQVWQLSAAGWQRRPGTMRQVAVAKGGGRVVAIDLQGKPFLWNGMSDWAPFLNAPVLSQIGIGGLWKIYGIGKQGEIYKFRSDKGIWARVKGSLRNISVAADGSIAGVNSDNKGYTRNDADVEAELNGTATQPQWVEVEEKLGSLEILDNATQVALDPTGLLVQRETQAPATKGGVIQIEADLVKSESIYEPAPEYIFNAGDNYDYDLRQCAPPAEGGTVSICLPTRLVAAGPSFGTNAKFKALPQVKKVTSTVSPSELATLFGSRGSGTSTAYVGRTTQSVAPNGPIACSPRHFRNVSDHSWSEFRLPDGVANQMVFIPAGAYNNYVFPACNRVWWDNLTFSCSAADGWKVIVGKYDADALCHGFPGSSPFVAVGNR